MIDIIDSIEIDINNIAIKIADNIIDNINNIKNKEDETQVLFNIISYPQTLINNITDKVGTEIKEKRFYG